MLSRIIVLLLITTLSFSGCKSKKKVVSSKKDPRTEKVIPVPKTPEPLQTVTFEDTTPLVEPPRNATYAEVVAIYIDNYSGIAMEEMTKYGIPASITIAQGILESGAGRGDLSIKANNHFGIKCHKEWTGDRVYHDDDELQECFRKYTDPRISYEDHSLFLTSRSRYQDLFKLRKDDYEGWAKGLKKAGYATDPKYPDKLIGIIERYDLTKYDDQVLGKKGSPKDSNTDKISTHTVQKGDTLYNISKRFDISVASLKEYNELKSDAISIGQVLYLQPVKNQN